jgi:hypothetical protein
MQKFSPIFFFIIVVLLAGCSSKYPMGISSEQWENLSVEEKTKLTLQQEKINTQKRKEQLQKYEIEKKHQLEAQKLEAQRIEKLYKEAQYGDLVNINLYGGLFEYGKHFLPMIPTATTIGRGETKQLQIVLKRDSFTYAKELWLYLSPMANKLTISFRKPSPSNIDEQIVILNNGKWDYEQVYTRSNQTRYDKIDKLKIGIRYTHTRRWLR